VGIQSAVPPLEGIDDNEHGIVHGDDNEETLLRKSIKILFVVIAEYH